jgi:putative (di)nucleoside polyphosphate hydrolase
MNDAYRPCAGIAMINRDGEVFIGRRIKGRAVPERAGFDWQMPPGGIDEGETPLRAARRELYEETNVSSVSLIAEAPEWLSYDLPAGLGGRWQGRYRGQTQKWFLFRVEGADSEIDIDRPAAGDHHAEFQEWRWERWEALPALIVPFKREVYQKVVALFAPIARGIRAPSGGP